MEIAESKLTPYTGIVSEGFSPHSPQLNHPYQGRFDKAGEAKNNADEEKQQQGIAHIGEHIQDIGFLPLRGGLTPCIQEVDLLPRIRIPSEVLGKLEEKERILCPCRD